MSATQPLGNITKFGSTKQENRDAYIGRRYRLLDTARELLPTYRVASCLHIPVPGKAIEVWREQKTGHAHLHGVGRCGNGWICPVCATRIAIGRADEIQQAIDAARAQALTPVFITFTASHQREDALSTTLTKQKAAMRSMRSSRAWGKLKETYGFTGQIDAWEITWGFGAGWHPHNHGLYFARLAPETQTLEGEIFTQWENAIGKQGLTCNRENGVKVLHGEAAVASYMAKWGLKSELTSNEKQGRKDNFTPFQLLALYEQGEAWAGGLYQEYAEATKGVSMIRWSRGLRAQFALSEPATDEELAEAETTEGAVKMLEIPRSDYRKLIYTGRRGILGEMLQVAERGREALIIWLSIFQIFIE